MISRTTRLAYRLLRIAALEDRIQFYAKNHKIPVEEVQQLAKADPADGKYLGWLAKNVIVPDHNPDAYLEDIRKILVFYQTVSKSKTLLEHVGLPADINKLNLDQLHDSWVRHRDEELTSKAEKSKKAKSTAKVLYSGGPYKVIQIGGEGADPQTAVETACSYSQGTAWCTKSENTAKGYLQRGPLFLAFKGKERMFLANYTGNEIKDPSNKDIVWTDEILLLALESGLLNFWADKNRGEVEDKIFDYLVYYLGIHPHEYPQFFQRLIDERLVSPERLSRYIETSGQELPQAEAYIATDPKAALIYAKYVISRPWPEGEPAIRSVPKYWADYQKYFKEELANVEHNPRDRETAARRYLQSRSRPVSQRADDAAGEFLRRQHGKHHERISERFL